MIFIDHLKGLYLPDFKFMESSGLIKKGTVVIGDNIICPGSPDYHEHFKQNNQYDSTLFHSYVEYSDIPDAVLVSVRIS
jgi:catechol O-methyltransferase